MIPKVNSIWFEPLWSTVCFSGLFICMCFYCFGHKKMCAWLKATNKIFDPVKANPSPKLTSTSSEVSCKQLPFSLLRGISLCLNFTSFIYFSKTVFYGISLLCVLLFYTVFLNVKSETINNNITLPPSKIFLLILICVAANL